MRIALSVALISFLQDLGARAFRAQLSSRDRKKGGKSLTLEALDHMHSHPVSDTVCFLDSESFGKKI